MMCKFWLITFAMSCSLLNLLVVGIFFWSNRNHVYNIQESTALLLNLAIIQILVQSYWRRKVGRQTCLFTYTDIEKWLQMPYFLRELGSHFRYEWEISSLPLIRFAHSFSICMVLLATEKKTQLQLNWEAKASAKFK